jgi:hypothetical protein
MAVPIVTVEVRAKIGTDAVRAAIEFAGEALKLTEMPDEFIRGTSILPAMRRRIEAMEKFIAMIEKK